jgi:hypothetical protein
MFLAGEFSHKIEAVFCWVRGDFLGLDYGNNSSGLIFSDIRTLQLKESGIPQYILSDNLRKMNTHIIYFQRIYIFPYYLHIHLIFYNIDIISFISPCHIHIIFISYISSLCVSSASCRVIHGRSISGVLPRTNNRTKNHGVLANKRIYYETPRPRQ